MADSTTERSIDPTPQRRQEARRQGHVVRSHDLVSAALWLVGLLALAAVGRGLVEFLGRYMAGQLGGRAWLSLDAALVESHFAETLRAAATHVLPVFGLLALGAVAANLGQTGFLFLPHKLALDATRLDPVRGLGRLFSLSTTSRLGFGILKILIAVGVAWFSLYGQRGAILSLSGASPPRIAAATSSLLLWTGLKIGVALFLLALLDYAWQRWKYEQDLKMTPEELRRELRESEGDPRLRGRRRNAPRQWAESRLRRI